MGMQHEKKWVILGLAVLALAIVFILGLQFVRSGREFAEAGKGAGTSEQVSSVKELAAGIKNPDTREQTIAALRAQEGDLVVELLTALGHKNKDPAVRAAALTALGDVGDDRGLQVLTIGVRDKAVEVRIAAVRALAEFGGEAAYSALTGAVSDIDARVRRTAAGTLIMADEQPVVAGALKTQFRAEPDVEIRRLIALAMGKLKDESVRRNLVGALQPKRGEKDASVRVAIVEALNAIEDSYRVEGVMCALADSHADVRTKAVGVLESLGIEALPALKEALSASQLSGLLRSDRGVDVHGRILATVAAMGKAPGAAGPLARLLDLAIAGDSTVRETREKTATSTRVELRDRAVDALGKLGEPAIAALGKITFRSNARLALKRAAAEVFARIGPVAVPALSEYVTGYKVLPSEEEVALWLGTLKRIGGKDAETLAAGVQQRNPDLLFKRYAAASLPPRDTTRRPPPQKQEFELILYKGLYAGIPPSAYARRRDSTPFAKGTRQEHEVRKFVPNRGRKHLTLDLTRLEDGWDRVVGHHLSLNNGIAFGKLTKAEVTDDAMDLEVKMAIGRDSWVPGGYAEYEISLKRQESGELRGTYKGHYHDTPIEGTAVARAKPARPPLRAGFRPVAPNEHPRLLFRREDLPYLRARLNTPLGRAAFRRMAMMHEWRGSGGVRTTGEHVALGMLYQLTGDKRYAMDAIPIIEREMADKSFGFMSLGQIWGERFTSIALAYDLCYDAWPEAYRHRLQRFMVRGAAATSSQMEQFSVCANTHPCSNYFAPIQGGGAMLALTFWMDPGGAPPTVPHAALLEPLPVSRCPEGVPVMPLVPGQAQTDWLWSGPVFSSVSPEDLMDALGTNAASTVREGHSFSIAGGAYTFHRVPEPALRGGDVYPWLAFSEMEPDYTSAGFVLFAVFRSVKEGFYQLGLPRQGAYAVSFGGIRSPHGSILYLKPGLYPVVFACAGNNESVSSARLDLRYIGNNRKHIEVMLIEGAEQYNKRRTLHELDLADHKRTGMLGQAIRPALMTMAQMYRLQRLYMGSGGFQAEGEGYTAHAVTPVRYAGACWNVLGQTVSAYPDVTHFVPRYIATGVLVPARHRPATLRSQSINGGGIGYNHGVRFLVPGFPYAPEELKPSLLWVWNKLKGVDENDPESMVKLLDNLDAKEIVYTFVNYPLDPATGRTSIKPVHPNEAFPRTWQATTKGLYSFRNQWKGGGDIVLQMYANETPTQGHGWPNAGALCLYGLGRDWTSTLSGKDGEATKRHAQNVVYLPAVYLSQKGGGRVTSWKAEDDGSGSVSMNLDAIYRPEGQYAPDRGGVWPLGPPGEYRINGMRAMAVDYSGKCGAPALIVLVDKITGAGDGQWLWHAPRGVPGKTKKSPGPPPPPAVVTAEGNSFTVKQGDATLHATFITPAGVKIETPGEVQYAAKKEGKRVSGPKAKVILTSTVPVVAIGGDSFFVVLTLQEGPAPEVIVEKGRGLDSVVRVGKQRVRFDGENAVIEDV